MKVNSTSSSTAASAPGASKGAAEGFRVDFGSGGIAPRTAVSGVSAAAGVSGVSALMALQGVDGPERRSVALRKGRRILEALDRLQVALLGEGPTKGHLGLLRRALEQRREASDDPELDETLHWAEVRAAVEVAKLERGAALA
ncbi:MAG: flagellar assembly protein FliX [Alphaproteobacteria bacterium]|nr:flagellar assembly protein FliX [Alphaproteobacteria bacterium]